MVCILLCFEKWGWPTVAPYAADIFLSLLQTCHVFCLCLSAMDIGSHLSTTFHQANTKPPEAITLPEEVSSRKFTLLTANDDFGLSPFDCNLILYTNDFIVCLVVSAEPMVRWLSGRTSVSDRRTFTGLHRTCSWWLTIYMGKPSAVGQPPRPTQPFILMGSINE